MDAITKLEVPVSAGKNTRKFFEQVTDLSEKEDVSITAALREVVKNDPRAFACYLVEIGVLTPAQAEEFGKSGKL